MWYAILLWIHFPVWRELKLNVNTVAPFHNCASLWIHFPVWRELKHLNSQGFGSRQAASEYTFPFEGNWNITGSACSSRVKIGSEYTFPFEGNWNLSFLRFFRASEKLWIHFPVWRELKLYRTSIIFTTKLNCLWIHFPVWRELKLCPGLSGVLT